MKKKTESVTVKLTAADRGFNLIVNIMMVLLLVILVVPLWSTLTLSFRPADFIGTYIEGMFMAPWKWSFDAYGALLGNNGFLLAFMNSIKIQRKKVHYYLRSYSICIQCRYHPNIYSCCPDEAY